MNPQTLISEKENINDLFAEDNIQNNRQNKLGGRVYSDPLNEVSNKTEDILSFNKSKSLQTEKNMYRQFDSNISQTNSYIGNKHLNKKRSRDYLDSGGIGDQSYLNKSKSYSQKSSYYYAQQHNNNGSYQQVKHYSQIRNQGSISDLFGVSNNSSFNQNNKSKYNNSNSSNGGLFSYNHRNNKNFEESSVMMKSKRNLKREEKEQYKQENYLEMLEMYMREQENLKINKIECLDPELGEADFLIQKTIELSKQIYGENKFQDIMVDTNRVASNGPLEYLTQFFDIDDDSPDVISVQDGSNSDQKPILQIQEAENVCMNEEKNSQEEEQKQSLDSLNPQNNTTSSSEIQVLNLENAKIVQEAKAVEENGVQYIKIPQKKYGSLTRTYKMYVKAMKNVDLVVDLLEKEIETQVQNFAKPYKNIDITVGQAIHQVLSFSERKSTLPKYGREGDWLCPAADCRNLNFKHRKHCNTCDLNRTYYKLDPIDVKNEDRHITEQEMLQHNLGAMKQQTWLCSACGFYSFSLFKYCKWCNQPRFINVQRMELLIMQGKVNYQEMKKESENQVQYETNKVVDKMKQEQLKIERMRLKEQNEVENIRKNMIKMKDEIWDQSVQLREKIRDLDQKEMIEREIVRKNMLLTQKKEFDDELEMLKYKKMEKAKRNKKSQKLKKLSSFGYEELQDQEDDGELQQQKSMDFQISSLKTVKQQKQELISQQQSSQSDEEYDGNNQNQEAQADIQQQENMQMENNLEDEVQASRKQSSEYQQQQQKIQDCQVELNVDDTNENHQKKEEILEQILDEESNQ